MVTPISYERLRHAALAASRSARPLTGIWQDARRTMLLKAWTARRDSRNLVLQRKEMAMKWSVAKTCVMLMVAMVVAVPGLSRAYLTVKVYRFEKMLPRADSEPAMLYVAGVGAGLYTANATLIANNRRPLFCMPKNLLLDEALARSLLDQELAHPSYGNTYPDTTSITIPLMTSLHTRFPCHEGK